MTSAPPTFIKFSSIHNVSKKTLEYALDVPSSTEWIVEEKVHGANFSFILDDVEGCRISCARRSGLISQDEHFYNYKELIAKHKDSLECVWKICKNNFPKITQVHVFGEVFGGFYGPDHPSSQRAKQVQREVLYHPENQFLPFDITLLFQEDDDKKRKRLYLPYDECAGIFQAVNMMFLPPMFRGSLEKALQVPFLFLTRIPAMYGLPDLPDNYSEGLIIRPCTPCWTKKGNRVIFKNKNEKFSEICRTPKQRVEKKATFSEEEYEILEKMMTYITQNRLTNILSHGDADESNKRRLAGMLCSDIWKEFQKENDVSLLSDGTKKAKARLLRELQKKCNEFVCSL